MSDTWMDGGIKDASYQELCELYETLPYDTQAYDTTTGTYYDDMGGYNG